MVEFKALGGFWVAVKMDEVSGGTLQMHVAISVGALDQLTAEEVGVEVWAGDVGLPLAQRPAQLGYLQTRAITAYADFVFTDSDNLAPTVVRVSLRNETEVWDVSDQLPAPPLVG